MPLPRLRLSIPGTLHPIDLPYFDHPPSPAGRRLPNGTIIVTDDATPSLLYKFVPWEKSSLSWNEVDTYARLDALADRSGIVQLLGVAGTPTHLVEKMERSRQGALDRFLFDASRNQADGIAPELVRSVLAQIAQTMRDIHALDIVHRDLKAENILVFDEQADAARWQTVRVKVADFDRAVALGRGEALEEPVGSLFHMGPELLAWERHDRKIDVYAFGILMYEVAHGGATPYANVGNGMPGSLSRTEFVQKVVHEDFRPAWRFDDAGLRELAARCWARDPEQRPEFAEICEMLQSGLPSCSVAGRTADQPKKSAHRRVGMASHIGRQRTRMEDAACVLQTAQAVIAGVFDGLRGAHASALSARRCAMALAAALDENGGDAEAAMRTAFALVEAALETLDPAMDCGSTAVVALLREDDLLVSWLGDSSACLFRRSDDAAGYTALDLVVPHHPDREDEALRVAAAGGVVAREQRWLDNGETIPIGPARVFVPDRMGKTGIALSRALGLFPFKPAISSVLETVRLARCDDDRYLVLGSDGVFDFLDRQAMFDIVSGADSMQDAADALIEAVLRLGAPDNATAIVIDLARGSADM